MCDSRFWVLRHGSDGLNAAQALLFREALATLGRRVAIADSVGALLTLNWNRANFGGGPAKGIRLMRTTFPVTFA